MILVWAYRGGISLSGQFGRQMWYCVRYIDPNKEIRRSAIKSWKPFASISLSIEFTHFILFSLYSTHSASLYYVWFLAANRTKRRLKYKSRNPILVRFPKFNRDQFLFTSKKLGVILVFVMMCHDHWNFDFSRHCNRHDNNHTDRQNNALWRCVILPL